MKKRFLALLLTLCLLAGHAAAWHSFRGSTDNMAITQAPVPTDAANVEEKWVTAESLKSGTGWNVTNPAPMLLVEGKIITTSGSQLLELDTETGEILRRAEMAGVNGTLGNSAPAYGDGMIFMPLQDGSVQAFDAETLSPLWQSENLGSQCTTGLVYKDGFIYGCTGNSSPGKVFCLKAEDENVESCQEKQAVWAIHNPDDDKGSYWSTPIVTDTAVVYGTDSGFLCSRKTADGSLISRLELPGGKQRSGIALYEGKVYGGTGSGYLFSAALAEDGVLSDLKAEKDETVSSITSTPVIYNDVVYYGGSKTVLAADAETLKTLRTSGETGFEQPRFGGAVQCSLLLHSGEDAVYLYATQNCKPGGLYLVKDTGTEMTATALHTPAEDKQEYCLVSPICDENGTIYYRNDSGYIFAVGAKQIQPPVPASVTASVSVLNHEGTALYEKTAKTLHVGATAYDILLQTSLEVDAVSGPYGMYVRSIAGLNEQTEGGLRYWMYEVNGESPTVGASSYVLQEGDEVCWKYYVEPTPPPIQPPVQPTTISVSVEVKNHLGAALFGQQTMSAPVGSTAYDLLQSTGLPLVTVNTEYGVYVQAIAGLAEKTMGEGSGWIYEVNGTSPSVGASNYILQNGDTLVWKFVAPAAPVAPSIPAAPTEQEKAPAVLPFTDAKGHWGEEAIRFVTEKNLMKGVSENCFLPEGQVTRSMVMTVLARMAGVDTAGGANWYEKALLWAKEQGITDGSNAEGIITREQLVTMLYRYFGTPEVKGDLAKYTDADEVSAYAQKAMIWAVENGIVNGMTESTLVPGGETIRAQLATILMHLAEVL